MFNDERARLTSGQLSRSKQSSRDCDSQAFLIRISWPQSACAALHAFT